MYLVNCCPVPNIVLHPAAKNNISDLAKIENAFIDTKSDIDICVFLIKTTSRYYSDLQRKKNAGYLIFHPTLSLTDVYIVH